jgi:hypothetical protein
MMHAGYYRVMTFRKFIFLVLVLVPLNGSAKFGRWAPQLSWYYGPGYRFRNILSHVVEFSFEYYQSTCLHARYWGSGLRFDHLRTGDYAISVKYFWSPVSKPRILLIPYLGISPSIMVIDKNVGFNLKPEVGLRFSTAGLTRRQPVSLSITISYGYDIPIVDEYSFDIIRHDISGKIGLVINIRDFANYFRSGKNR